MPLRITLVLTAVGVLLAGCGGGTHASAPPTGERAAKAEYGRRAGAILRPTGGVLAHLRVEMTRAGTTAQARVEAARLERTAGSARARLAALVVPSSIAAPHHALLTELAEVRAEGAALDRIAARRGLTAFLARASAFENGAVFGRLAATIASFRSAGVNLGLGETGA